MTLRLAWFRATPPDLRDPLDAGAALVEALRLTHQITMIDSSNAHDLVWQRARGAIDLCVYELDAPTDLARAYLMHDPGIIWLKTTARPQLPAVLARARLVVAPDAALAATLQDMHPGVHVRCIPPAVRAIPTAPREPERRLIAWVPDRTAWTLATRAAERAAAAGTAVELNRAPRAQDGIGGSDVVLALGWPPSTGLPIAALAGMAAGKPVVVFEGEASAAWPALNPQDWQPRDRFSTAAPVCVSLDPRDDEHSLMLTLRRLAADAPLRAALAEAGEAWWRQHAQVEQVAAQWNAVLEEAARLPPPSIPAHFPPELLPDGTERARAILSDFGVRTDLF